MNGVIQSGFWHQFAMTAHSPVGLAPADFQVETIGPEFEGFAKNDLEHNDPVGVTHELFSAGLKKSLFNYMNGVGFDFHLSEWFEHEVPETTVDENYIDFCISNVREKEILPNHKIIWRHGLPINHDWIDDQGDLHRTYIFEQKNLSLKIDVNEDWQDWLTEIFPKFCPSENTPITVATLQKEYEEKGFGVFNDFIQTNLWQTLRQHGLLIL